MSNVMIINAGKAFLHSEGALNQLMAETAKETLAAQGHDVRITNVDEGYDIETEIESFLWADVVIYQQPAWWMGSPWILKKYLDEVLTYGHGKLYASDGRSRHDSSKKYGSGGLLHGKKYLLSATWNAPVTAFTDPDDFFEGKGLDAVYFPFHKMNEFIGMSALPSFMINDVIKDPKIEEGIAQFKAHLLKHIC